jgi:pimeloyl-ACP methyl ester carboxylesterase
VTFADINNTRLYHETAGPQGSEPLVFIHGFSLDTRMWDDQWDFFAQHYRVIRYDVRGFGKSSLPGTEPYAQVADLKALLEHLQAAPAHIAGLSMGGGIAIDFAAAYPELIRSLVAVDAALGGFAWTSDLGAPGRIARASGLEAGKAAWLNDALFAPAHEQPAVSARLREMVTDYSGYHWLNRDPGRWADVEGIQRLDQIRALSLAIVGERDLPDFHVIADLLVEKIPNCRKVVLPGAGHLSNMEAPEQFNQLVLNFLKNQLA